MKAALLLLLTPVFLFAGCLESSSGVDPSETFLAPGEPWWANRINGTLQQFEKVFDFILRGAEVPQSPISTDHFSGPACVTLEASRAYRLFNGTATATWTAATPLSEKLRLTVHNGTWAEGTGDKVSPLVYAFDNFTYSGGSNTETPHKFEVRFGANQAALDQPVKVTLKFEYVSQKAITAMAHCH